MSDPAPIAEADLFTVPLLDGGVGLGQIISTNVNGAVQCLLSGLRDPVPRRIPEAAVLAILFTDPRPFRTQSWSVIGYDSLPEVARTPDSLLTDDAPVVRDPAIVEAFLNACHGLYPWDGFPDAKFFSSLLLPGLPDPRTRRMQSEFS